MYELKNVISYQSCSEFGYQQNYCSSIGKFQTPHAISLRLNGLSAANEEKSYEQVNNVKSTSHTLYNFKYTSVVLNLSTSTNAKFPKWAQIPKV